LVTLGIEEMVRIENRTINKSSNWDSPKNSSGYTITERVLERRKTGGKK